MSNSTAFMAWKTAQVDELNKFDITLRVALALGYREWERKNDGFSIQAPDGEVIATRWRGELEDASDNYYFNGAWFDAQSYIMSYGTTTGIALTLPFAPATLEITVGPDTVQASIHNPDGGMLLSKRVTIEDPEDIDNYTALAICRAWLEWKEGLKI